MSPLEFSRAWLVKVEEVRRRRAELVASGQLDGMTPYAAALAGAALTGTLRVPVVPIVYADVAEPFPVSALQDRLFGPTRGDTISYADYWKEVSSGLLQVEGRVAPWVRLPKAAAHYLAPEKFGWGEFGRMHELRQQVLKLADDQVDFSQFDNDGPDGIPNSADDDGFVDFVAILYATPCGGDSRAGAIWPHRAAMPPFETNDVTPLGKRIRIADYVVLPATEPTTCAPLHVGVLAHETGHALGLPDLYDYDASSQGIGAWGLMGSGSHSSRFSPAHLSAWEKEQLGWVEVDWLRSSGAIELKPVNSTPSVLRYDIPNTKGEYLLLENRQRAGSDQYLPGKGLLAWHIDPERGELGAWNSDERRPAVSLMEADGQDDLRRGARADSGDPFPGSRAKHTFAPAKLPMFRLDRIIDRQGVITAEARLGYAGPTVVLDQAAMRLSAMNLDSAITRTLPVHVEGDATTWVAQASAPWLSVEAAGDSLRLRANASGLDAGRYSETVHFSVNGLPAGALGVDLHVGTPGVPQILATELPWSWGLATTQGTVMQASYGWDESGLRPRPRVLKLQDGQLHPETLARIPADALFAPVVTRDGHGTYVLARARGDNFVWRVGRDGSARMIVPRVGTSPAYGAVLLPDGALAVAEWNGTVWRVTDDGAASPYAQFDANIYQIASDGAGAIYAASYEGSVLRAGPGERTGRIETGFRAGELVALTMGRTGELYIAERGGEGRVLRLSGTDRQIIFQRKNAQFYGLAVDDQFVYALDLRDRQLLRIPKNGP